MPHWHQRGRFYVAVDNAIAGGLTLRWAYYWQDDSWAREFNIPGDKIDSWDKRNASLIYESTNGQWSGRAFVRNIEDEDNVTGHYVTSDTSGFFRIHFLTGRVSTVCVRPLRLWWLTSCS